jgi:hypothetical protein
VDEHFGGAPPRLDGRVPIDEEVGGHGHELARLAAAPALLRVQAAAVEGVVDVDSNVGRLKRSTKN